MVEKFGIPKEQLLMIPDNFDIRKDDIHFLMEIRRKISKMIENYQYERRCQWKKSEPKSCDVKVPNAEECSQCKYYYSNDDRKWFDED